MAKTAAKASRVGRNTRKSKTEGTAASSGEYEYPLQFRLKIGNRTLGMPGTMQSNPHYVTLKEGEALSVRLKQLPRRKKTSSRTSK
jgi:hypothetical protein